jgi:hypothetical protein
MRRCSPACCAAVTVTTPPTCTLCFSPLVFVFSQCCCWCCCGCKCVRPRGSGGRRVAPGPALGDDAVDHVGDGAQSSAPSMTVGSSEPVGTTTAEARRSVAVRQWVLTQRRAASAALSQDAGPASEVKLGPVAAFGTSRKARPGDSDDDDAVIGGLGLGDDPDVDDDDDDDHGGDAGAPSWLGEGEGDEEGGALLDLEEDPLLGHTAAEAAGVRRFSFAGPGQGRPPVAPPSCLACRRRGARCWSAMQPLLVTVRSWLRVQSWHWLLVLFFTPCTCWWWLGGAGRG